MLCHHSVRKLDVDNISLSAMFIVEIKKVSHKNDPSEFVIILSITEHTEQIGSLFFIATLTNHTLASSWSQREQQHGIFECHVVQLYCQKSFNSRPEKLKYMQKLMKENFRAGAICTNSRWFIFNNNYIVCWLRGLEILGDGKYLLFGRH